jgi:anti-sigma regulatory factor (Ser/Thr protein kinase)
LSSTLEAPSQGRRYVRHRLTEAGHPELIDNATVIVSELVTNAIRAAPEDPVWVALRTDGDRQILEVQDCSPVLPALEPADLMAEGGRGLRVVAALAAELGCTPVSGGKILWAVLQ